MKIEVTDLSPVKKRIAVEAEPSEVETETEQVLRRYIARVKVPGFRPGKVPASLVRSRFAEEIRADVRERLVGRLYSDATRERGLKPLGDPVLDALKDAEGEPFRFEATFEVSPEFSPRSYRDIDVREPNVTVTEADVEKTLQDLRESATRLVVADGNAAGTGDVVIADVEGEPEGAEPFRRERVMIEVGSTDNLPEFNERLHGAEAGTSLDFHVIYPKEYEAAPLAGKAVRYRLAVHEIKRKEVPALDDDFAREMGDFENLAALRERIRKDLEERKTGESRRTVRQRLLDKILLENPVVLPDVLVDEETQHRLEDMVRAMMLQGIDPQKIKVDWKEMRERQAEPARKSVHARLVLDAIAAVESIAVGEDDVKDRIRAEAERIGESYDKIRGRLSKGGGMEALRDQLLREKTLDFLVSVANIQRED